MRGNAREGVQQTTGWQERRDWLGPANRVGRNSDGYSTCNPVRGVHGRLRHSGELMVASTRAGRDEGKPALAANLIRLEYLWAGSDPSASTNVGPSIYQTARVYWETGMGTPGAGGGVEGFCWLEYNSWPGDFVAPSPHATLAAKPWVHGDADYANWGLDTANIVLYNGDGDPTGRSFAEMDPDSTADKCPSSYICHPNGSTTLEHFPSVPAVSWISSIFTGAKETASGPPSPTV